ncbi:MAG TPA: hypothetical protein VE573_20075, partial [Nitrososphaeraceae archaeon]|nr:hypothetical protein [Nitrososphaeraceae archaeon]
MYFFICEDKEQTILRKNTYFYLEGGGKTNGKLPNNINGIRVYFLICPSCFWCASSFENRISSIIKCPNCHS